MSEAQALDRSALDRHPLPSIDEGDKHSHGRLLVIAGTRSLAGAALLCATAAMRSGAGKLKIATVATVAPHVGVAMPESSTIGMDEDEDGGFAESAVGPLGQLASEVDAVVAGPGMFESPACGRLAAELLGGPAALALDAGLLRSLLPHASASKQAKQAPILLPHAGELAALLECEKAEVEQDPVGCGRVCAERYRALTLVKGVTSHVVHRDGRIWTYQGGAPGLGVSGSGDILAGIVAGLLARGAEPLHALLWSVWLHGEAGARLAGKVGPVGFLARELADEIPALLPR
jgi:ADP-dependent NAD(P)H-hydrate dehydratase